MQNLERFADGAAAGQQPVIAQEKHVEEEIVEAARVTHDVDHGAARLQIAQALHAIALEIEVSEEALRKHAKCEAEA